MMTYYDHFVIPFLVGTVFMFAVILWKWGRWLWHPSYNLRYPATRSATAAPSFRLSPMFFGAVTVYLKL